MPKYTQKDRLQAASIVNKYMERNEKTQAEIADQLNTYPSVISLLARGHRVSSKMMEKVFKELKV